MPLTVYAGTCAVIFFLINPTRCTNFPKFYSVIKTLHVSGISFAHHQELSTVHSAMVYFLQVWWQFPSRVRMFHP